MTSYKQLLSILLFLCVFLDLPIKSKENNLRKSSNILRHLQETSTTEGLSLTIKVINETVICEDNTVLLPLFNPFLDLSDKKLKFEGKESSVAECKPKSGNTKFPTNQEGKLQGLNFTYYSLKKENTTTNNTTNNSTTNNNSTEDQNKNSTQRIIIMEQLIIIL